MAQSDALLILPACKHPGEEKAALQTAAPLLTQSLEDLRLAGRIERALRAAGHGPLRAVAVSVSGRAVMLLGRVPSYYLKQIAQSISLAVPGAHQIYNGLEVVQPN
jgi:osmotically-inducible protein OsmY